MTQPTAELLQAIKGLAEKANLHGEMIALDGNKGAKGSARFPRVVGCGEELAYICTFSDYSTIDRDFSNMATAELTATLYNNLPTIIAALELKERVEKAGGYMLVNGSPLMPQSGGASASDRGPMR